ncbi:MAG: hypothetical protein LC722_06145, partial [Actinobacteria bacterium]|nr:hypothetical protein [Actinomycetota bacterium]
MNLRDYLLILRRRKWIGILVLATTLATVALLTTLATPLYEARSTMFIGPQPASAQDVSGGTTSTIFNLAQQLQKTYARILQTLPVAQKAVQDGDLRTSPQYVLSRMTVTAVEDTTLLELRIRDPDPVAASNMANEVALAFVDTAAALTTPPSANNPVVPVTLIEPATVPVQPVSPNASRNLALAAVLGVVIGAGLMFAAEYLDVAVRGPDDVERLTQLPV